MPLDRIEAMFGFDDFHEIPARFVAMLPSLNVPVALYLIDVPFAILAPARVTAMDTRWAVDTVRVVEPLTDPDAAVMVAVPFATLVARPWPLMVATAAEEEVQSTELVMSCVLESLKVPVAENCFVVPTAMLEFAGVTAIDTSVAAVTVSDAVPLTDPDVAVIVVVPALTPDASPPELTLATELDNEFHVTDVNSCVLPSSKLPTALNCCWVPTAIDGVAGLTEIEVKFAATTVSVEVSVNEPTVAVIVVCPAATVVATPELAIVATAVDDEVHVTPVVRSELEPSL
jgi:hypothetical protein